MHYDLLQYFDTLCSVTLIDKILQYIRHAILSIIFTIWLYTIWEGFVRLNIKGGVYSLQINESALMAVIPILFPFRYLTAGWIKNKE